MTNTGAGGILDSHIAFGGYQGMQFPDTVHPDFTQSDVTLRYLVKILTPDGTIQGAALVFTLQRAPEGYRPQNVTVEPLTGAERQSIEGGPQP